MIGYPNKKKTTNTAMVSNHTMNRGMSLESDLNLSNDYYRTIDKALIYKKPTPIQVVHVDYPIRNKAKITEAYYKVPSTTDYNGIYKGRAIDFEAKETRLKTLFPFTSIHSHQIEHLKKVLYHGGIGFLILRFSVYNETYLIEADYLIKQYENPDKKSLMYNEVKQVGYLIKEGFNPRLDYLEIVEKLYFKEESR